MKTTLNLIKPQILGKDSLAKLLKHLGKTQADDAPLSIREILSSNGLMDALWCLRAVKGRGKEIRLLSVAFARRVQHLMPDPRSIAALDVAERFAYGLATKEELEAARAAAVDAAVDAAMAAAVGAAVDAAVDAAMAAAQAVALHTDAAMAALDVELAAERDAPAGGAIAWAAERQAQTQLLIELCERCEAEGAASSLLATTGPVNLSNTPPTLKNASSRTSNNSINPKPHEPQLNRRHRALSQPQISAARSE